MAEKLKRLIIGPGELVYPKISRPDTFGQYGDNKYKTGLRVTTEVGAPIVEEIKAFAASKGLKKLITEGQSKNVPFHIEEDGFILFTGKSSQERETNQEIQPLIVDAKNKPLPKDVIVGGGTIANVEFALNWYPREGKANGVNFKLYSVQVLDLVEYQPRGASPFEETDGFEVDDAPPTAPTAKTNAADLYEEIPF